MEGWCTPRALSLTKHGVCTAIVDEECNLRQVHDCWGNLAVYCNSDATHSGNLSLVPIIYSPKCTQKLRNNRMSSWPGQRGFRCESYNIVRWTVLLVPIQGRLNVIVLCGRAYIDQSPCSLLIRYTKYFLLSVDDVALSCEVHPTLNVEDHTVFCS